MSEASETHEGRVIDRTSCALTPFTLSHIDGMDDANDH